MNTQTSKNPVRWIIAVLVMTAMLASACSFSHPRVYLHDQVVVDITIYEDELNDPFSNNDLHFSGHYGVYFSTNDGVSLTDHCRHVLDRVTRVELHAGYIRFVGTKLQPDGSEVEGSLDLSLSSEKDQLKGRILAMDIPGMDLKHRCVVEANEELEFAFSHMLDDTP